MFSYNSPRNSSWIILLSFVGASALPSCSSKPPDFSTGDGDGDGDGSMGGTKGDGDGDADSTSSDGKGDGGGDGKDDTGSSSSGDGDTSSTSGDGDEAADVCADHDCKNNASCEPDGDGYKCECADGFSGPKCEVDVDDCEDSPCENGGACKDGVDSYSCDCSGTGYVGDSCELLVAAVLPVHPTATDCAVRAVSDTGDVFATCSLSIDVSVGSYLAYGTTSWKDLSMPTGYQTTEAVGMSADGQILAGTVYDGAGKSRAVRWATPSSSALILPTYTNTTASLLSGDGTQIVGNDGDDGSILVWTGTGNSTTYAASSSASYVSPHVTNSDGSLMFGGAMNGVVRWDGKTPSFEPTSESGFRMGSIAGCNSDGSVVVGTGGGDNGDGIWQLEGSKLTWMSGTDACAAADSDASTNVISGHCSNLAYLWINGSALDVAVYLAEEGSPLEAGVDLVFYSSRLSPNGAFVASDTSDGGVLLMRVP